MKQTTLPQKPIASAPLPATIGGGKIYGIDELTRTLEQLKTEGKKIVQCHGVFDLVHVGHIRHLSIAKQQGDVLVVTLTKDVHIRKGPGRPIFNENLRAETLAALETVDFVCLVDEPTAVGCIAKIKPDLYVKGPDYRDSSQDVTGKILEEEEAVQRAGGEIFFTSDEVVFSSTHLINRFLGVFSDQQRLFLQHIRDTYGSEVQIIERIKKLGTLRVLLIGDTIIDEYAYCEPMGQSLKNPLVVHKFLREEKFCGGVAAIANQVAQFCQEVHLVTLLGGKNPQEEYIRSQLLPNVHADFFVRSDIPTIVKRRYLYENVEQKVFEVCTIDDATHMPEPLSAQMAQFLQKILSEYDLVMIADYGHGVMTDRIVADLYGRPKFLAVNAQTNSANLGYNFITKKYRGIDFASIDEGEARLALQDRHEGIQPLGKLLADRLQARQLMITRGRHGSIGFEQNGTACVAPTFATQVVDRVGAGDAFFAVTAPCSAVGMPLDLVSFIGNAVGALAVQVVGNRETIAPAHLFKFITTLLK